MDRLNGLFAFLLGMFGGGLIVYSAYDPLLVHEFWHVIGFDIGLLLMVVCNTYLVVKAFPLKKDKC